MPLCLAWIEPGEQMRGTQFILLAWASGLASLLPTPIAHAVGTNPSVPYYEIHQPYVSPRALGMGNAFSTMADDYATLFYNPAGLARLREGNLNLAVTAGLDGKVQQFYEDINKNLDTNTSAADLATLIAANYGNHYYTRLTPVSAVYARPNWGFAIIPADLSVSLGIHQQVGPSIEVTAFNDTTLAFGFAKSVKNIGQDKLSFGMTVKPIWRAYYAQLVPAPQLATDKEIVRADLAQEGATVDGDIGALWTPAPAEKGFFSFFKYAKPTLGLVVRNVADYGFTIKTRYINELEQAPPNLERRVDAGTMFELPSFWVFRPRLTFDERDIGARNFTFKKGSHAGFELGWKVRSWLHGGYRVGLNQGYWTAGVSLGLGVFLLDVATWGEEVGTSAAPEENRRYMARASLDF